MANLHHTDFSALDCVSTATQFHTNDAALLDCPTPSTPPLSLEFNFTAQRGTNCLPPVSSVDDDDDKPVLKQPMHHPQPPSQTNTTARHDTPMRLVSAHLNVFDAHAGPSQLRWLPEREQINNLRPDTHQVEIQDYAANELCQRFPMAHQQGPATSDSGIMNALAFSLLEQKPAIQDLEDALTRTDRDCDNRVSIAGRTPADKHQLETTNWREVRDNLWSEFCVCPCVVRLRCLGGE
jgi:hypothetical protein